ncbi:MAG: DUF4330 family protein [Clostridia bacterium]|nr:DUF4330 family protein [Clostridia bacterium]
MEKRKHKFNIIDAIVVLLIVAAVVFAVVKIVKNASDKTADVSLTFVMQTDMIPDELSDNVSVGDPIYDGATGRKIGEVTACDTRPAQHTGSDTNGTPVVSDVPGYKTLYVTCSAICESGDDGYTVEGVQISSGRRYVLMFPSLYCEGECISISVGSGS